MRVGLSINLQNYLDGEPNHQYAREDLYFAEIAESLGFDIVAFPEHHFTSYSLSPDPFQTLAWLAARTERIDLCTAAIILPWNDPLRVAEQVTVLDNLSNGRVIFGMGRGLSPREYAGYRQDMNESRERFDEAAELLIRALTTGSVEGDGPYYVQPRVEIRPRAEHSFAGRMYIAAFSLTSAETAARLGAGLMHFPGGPIEQ